MLNELSNEIYENAKAHGWHDKPRNVLEIAALCHSEISEAVEEHRADKPTVYCNNHGGDFCPGDMTCEKCYAVRRESGKAPHKPEGTAVEMIDCIIRILDWCGSEGIDVDTLMRWKMDYNEGRPYKHGKKC